MSQNRNFMKYTLGYIFYKKLYPRVYDFDKKWLKVVRISTHILGIDLPYPMRVQKEIDEWWSFSLDIPGKYNPPILLGYRDNYIVAKIGSDGIDLIEVDENDISEN